MTRRIPGAIRGRAIAPLEASLRTLSFTELSRVVRTQIERRLDRFLRAEQRATAKLGPEVMAMVGALSDLCRRKSKRLRPTLLVAGALGVRDRVEFEVLLEAGVALELLQAYFLIHDDWMDQDAVRRGGPSVHTLLIDRFKDRHTGEASAILAGDYCLALSTSLLASLPVASQRQRGLFEIFGWMQRSAVQGQQIDIVGRSQDVERGYALKTGSYSVRGPLQLGATLAGGSAEMLRSLARFSEPLGVAFQLRDDLLGAFGAPEKTGKPLGADVRAGKRTPLLLNALARARGEDRRVLGSVVGNSKARVAEVREVLRIFERTGARAAVESRIQRLTNQALDALGPDLTARGRSLLSGAAQTLTERVE